jgi:hypothetical protein
MSLIGEYLKKFWGGEVDASDRYAAIVAKVFLQIEEATKGDALTAEQKIEAIYQACAAKIESAGAELMHTKLWQAIDNELRFREAAMPQMQAGTGAASEAVSDGAVLHDGLGGGNGP